jgi:glycosyltransferase involved in cell wall biosynthesis
MHGFQQPDAVAEQMRAASCFVLPSRAEPYGVVVHEAASAALPMLCTDFAGAVPMFVQDGANGWTVAAGRVDVWADAMARMSTQPADRLEEMSAISHALSTRISPSGWARHVHEEFERRITTGAVAARQPQGIR